MLKKISLLILIACAIGNLNARVINERTITNFVIDPSFPSVSCLVNTISNTMEINCFGKVESAEKISEELVKIAEFKNWSVFRKNEVKNRRVVFYLLWEDANGRQEKVSIISW